MQSPADGEHFSGMTPRQRLLIERWRRAWWRVGASTEPADRPGATEALRSMVRFASRRRFPIVWADGPLTGQLLFTLLKPKKGGTRTAEEVLSTIKESALREAVGASFTSSLEAIPRRIRRQLRHTAPGAPLVSPLFSARGIGYWRLPGSHPRVEPYVGALYLGVTVPIERSLISGLVENVFAALRVALSTSPPEGWSYRGYGHACRSLISAGRADAGWLSFEAFGLRCPQYQPYGRLTRRVLTWYAVLARKCGFVWGSRDLVVASEPPCRLSWERNEPGAELHADGAPAVEYPSGWKLYFLHGVRVPREIAMTPAEAIDPHVMIETRSTEVRRAILRKIGIERACSMLPTEVVDRRQDYVLLTVYPGDGEMRRYLEMQNPSTGKRHIEAVDPACETVQQALNYRRYGDPNGGSWQPTVLR